MNISLKLFTQVYLKLSFTKLQPPSAFSTADGVNNTAKVAIILNAHVNTFG